MTENSEVSDVLRPQFGDQSTEGRIAHLSQALEELESEVERTAEINANRLFRAWLQGLVVGVFLTVFTVRRTK